jgi:hypothetical protein
MAAYRSGSGQRSDGATAADAKLHPVTPEMRSILKGAAAHPEGHVCLSRPREGVWPEELRLFRTLEREGCLRLLATRDRAADGEVTATYAITHKGRAAAAEGERKRDRPPGRP